MKPGVAPNASPPRSFLAWYGVAGGAIALGPWLALHLQDVGLSPSAIAGVLMALPIGRLLGAPLWGWAADRASPSVVLRTASVLSCLVALGLMVVDHPVILAGLVLAWALAITPWFPIVDAATVQLVGRNYGRVRAIASLAFLVSMVVAGLLRDRWVLAPLAISTALTFLAAIASFQLPTSAPPPKPPSWRALLALLQHRELRALLGASALHGATMTSYDLLFATHLEGLGGSSAAVGAAFALGVGVEIVVLLVAVRVLRKIDPALLMLVGLSAGIPRFLVTGLATSVPVLVITQGLHGLHFGAFWVAATALFAERAPDALRNTTQALLPAAAYGAGPLIGLTSAALWLRWGPLSTFYLAMAALSAVACALLWPQALRAIRRAIRSRRPE